MACVLSAVTAITLTSAAVTAVTAAELAVEGAHFLIHADGEEFAT